jgi:hypothetical protein
MPNGHKVCQMVIKGINIFHPKAFQNVPQLVVLVGKMNHLATLNSSHKESNTSHTNP